MAYITMNGLGAVPTTFSQAVVRTPGAYTPIDQPGVLAFAPTTTAAPTNLKNKSVASSSQYSSSLTKTQEPSVLDTIGDTLAAILGAGAAVAPTVMAAVEAKRAQTQARRDARQQALQPQEVIQAGSGISMMPIALGALGLVIVGAWLFSGRSAPAPRVAAPRVQYKTRTVYRAKPKAKAKAKPRKRVSRRR